MEENKNMAKHHKEMLWIDWIVIVLLLVGGLNWGLWGFFKFNLVSYIFSPMLATIAYMLVGVATIIGLLRLFMKK